MFISDRRHLGVKWYLQCSTRLAFHAITQLDQVLAREPVGVNIRPIATFGTAFVVIGHFRVVDFELIEPIAGFAASVHPLSGFAGVRLCMIVIWCSGVASDYSNIE